MGAGSEPRMGSVPLRRGQGQPCRIHGGGEGRSVSRRGAEVPIPVARGLKQNTMASLNKASKPRIRPRGVTQVPWAVTLTGKPSFKISGTLGVRVRDEAVFKRGGSRRQKKFQDAVAESIKVGFKDAGKTLDEVTLQLDGAALESRLNLKHRLADLGLELVDFLVLSATAGRKAAISKSQAARGIKRRTISSRLSNSTPIRPRSSMKSKKSP